MQPRLWRLERSRHALAIIARTGGRELTRAAFVAADGHDRLRALNLKEGAPIRERLRLRLRQ